MSDEVSTDRGTALRQHTDADEAAFDAGSIGVAGDTRQYHVTEEAMRAYAAATDDILGGPVFAIVPVWATIAPASRSVASDEARTRVVHYEHDIVAPPADRARMTLSRRERRRSRCSPVRTGRRS